MKIIDIYIANLVVNMYIRRLFQEIVSVIVQFNFGSKMVMNPIFPENNDVNYFLTF